MTFLFYGVIYFMPALAGWLAAKVTGAELPLRRLFLLNLLAGWTGLGWIGCWVYLIVKILPRGRATAGGSSAAGGTGYTPSAATYELPTQQRRTCGSCGGSGHTTCFMCSGQGGRWTQPVTATDTSRWEACGSCTSSGKVSCTSCSGSGYG